MTSAQLILVSVSSALIAVIAMLVVATVLRARTREGTGSDLSQPTGTRTRAQRAATRAHTRAQRAMMRADKKAAKAAASVTKSEKKKAAAAALAAAKTEPADNKPAVGDEAAEKVKSEPEGTDAKKDGLEGTGDKPNSQLSTGIAGESSATPEDTDALVVPDTRGRLGGTAGQEGPDKKDDEVATTEAGKKAAVAKPKSRRSLLRRGQSTEDEPEKKS